ncbi:inositol/phosphatidylinositol phosphatase [Cantharellus anzutake]|uniref:inositol/phosphatidylinositol phosphatase n=1 Tax=Cantharellus anzutake TaxID=1750568 RepID=UPI001907AB64|nr:inositol/phosphatidylinositol phosphatase [Cantharellus anzutake]KAF8324844.1 inositol/phosphatidylinositol phosphatase [Cantharellus anzutake]
MASSKALHQSFNLYITPDVYLFEPTDSNGNADTFSKSLVISRHSAEITLSDSSVSTPSKSFHALTVYGIMGILPLTTTDYLVLITGRSPARGRMNGHTIYLATEFRVLPIATPSANTLISHPVERHLVGLVENHLSASVLWFSYGWDLTRSLQAQALRPSEGKALWETLDDRFFWNKYIQSRFIDITTSNSSQDLSQFILPVMYGSFEMRQLHIGRIPFNFVLISRRSRYRAGTRYFTRGIDSEGHVANYNETEQIIFIDDEDDAASQNGSSYGYGGLTEVKGTTRMSFVQTRGSAPFYWAEINNLRYKPDLQIMEKSDTLVAFRLHIREQLQVYGKQLLLNLVKQKGHEKPVKEAYERVVSDSKLPDVRYEYYDFATETKGMKFEKIKSLIDRLRDQLEEIGYCRVSDTSSAPVRQQNGVVRTNCMDCLDRTNVVQSALAKEVLTMQLRSIGVLSEKESLDDHEDFMEVFRNVWADHADYISKAYSGTGALKTDYTRTGKRTKQGLIQDGQNSIVRYLKNNYFDGHRQDALDLFSGAWIPRKGPAMALALVTDSRPLVTQAMPYVLFFSIFMVFAGMILPRQSKYSLYYYNLFWFLFITISLVYILGHGVEYVQWPRLNPPNEVIFYEGPGYKSGRKGTGFTIPFGLHDHLLKRGVKLGGTFSGSGAQHRRGRADEIEMGLKKRTD